jgi:hypothetical protein
MCRVLSDPVVGPWTSFYSDEYEGTFTCHGEGVGGGDTLIVLAPHSRHAPYTVQMAEGVDRTGIEPWPIIRTSVRRANSSVEFSQTDLGMVL